MEVEPLPLQEGVYEWVAWALPEEEPDQLDQVLDMVVQITFAVVDQDTLVQGPSEHLVYNPLMVQAVAGVVEKDPLEDFLFGNIHQE